MEEYHTIIVGGGPAGLQCARKLAEYGYKVILFEENKVPGEPNYSTAGIPKEAFDKFNLSNECIGHSFSKTSFITSKQNLSWDFGKVAGYTLDFKKMKLGLAEDIKSKGGAIKYDAKVTNLETDKEGILSIQYLENGKPIKCKAKYYIDASGFSGVLASKVGLRKQHQCSPAIGIEKVIKIKLDESFNDKIVLYFGDKYVPYGYAWVFHFGDDIYKIGVCTYSEHKLTKKKKHLNTYLNEFISSIGQGEVIEEHGAPIFVTGGYKKNSWKNTIMIGDTASTINPVLGEGIRHALQSGDFAADTIHDLETGKIKSLSNYDNLLKNYRKNKWRISKLFSNIIATSNNCIINFLLRQLEKLSPEEFYKAGYEYDYYFLLKKILF